MNLAELQKEAHAIAKDHGWYDTERTFGDLIALVHSELGAALEAYRDHGLSTMARCWGGWGYVLHPVDEECFGGGRHSAKREGVPSELADVVIRVADMAEYYDWDLSGWEDVDTSHNIIAPTFGDWICLIHASLSFAFVGTCTTLQRSEWIGPLKAALRLVHDMAADYGIDLDAAIEAKMQYNRSRPYRHGGKAL